MTVGDDVFRRGDIVAQLYEIQGVIGRGGFGQVYVAQHIHLGRRVAIKVLHRQRDTPENRAALLAEAKTLAALAATPAVVAPFDFRICDKHQVVYLAMELLEGRTLRAQLSALSRGVTPRGAVVLGIAIATGLVELHERGFCHGDLTPSNVFLQFDAGVIERIRLLDLGAAVSATRPGAARRGVAAPAYLAPEQRRNPPEVSPQTDLHALGQVVFETLTLQSPFEDDPDAVPPELCEVSVGASQGLNDLVAQMLSADPGRRPESAGAVLAALRGVHAEHIESTEPDRLFGDHLIPRPKPEAVGPPTVNVPRSGARVSVGAEFFFVVDGPLELLQIRFPISGVRHFIGRDPAQVDMVLPHHTVSRRHCAVLAVSPGLLEIHDLKSTRGTYASYHKRGSFLIEPGERLHIGDVVLELRTHGAS